VEHDVSRYAGPLVAAVMLLLILGLAGGLLFDVLLTEPRQYP
jgi:hypothetical protein